MTLQVNVEPIATKFTYADVERKTSEAKKSIIFRIFQVAVDEEVKNGISKVKDKFGRLDAVINCAGIVFNRKTFSFNSPDLAQKSASLSDLSKVLNVSFSAHQILQHT